MQRKHYIYREEAGEAAQLVDVRHACSEVAALEEWAVEHHVSDCTIIAGIYSSTLRLYGLAVEFVAVRA